MTTQIFDTIFFNGKEHLLVTEPLSALAKLPDFLAMSTANHRGYVAVWAVVGNRLFIVSLTGHVPNTELNGLDLIFPSAQAPIFADWYSGELHLLRGRALERSEITQKYEHETFLSISEGVIKNQHTLNRIFQKNEHYDPILFQPLSYLDGIDINLISKLSAKNIVTIGDLIQFGELKIAQLGDMSVESAIELTEILGNYGLRLGTPLFGWPPKKQLTASHQM